MQAIKQRCGIKNVQVIFTVDGRCGIIQSRRSGQVLRRYHDKHYTEDYRPSYPSSFSCKTHHFQLRLSIEWLRLGLTLGKPLQGKQQTQPSGVCGGNDWELEPLRRKIIRTIIFLNFWGDYPWSNQISEWFFTSPFFREAASPACNITTTFYNVTHFCIAVLSSFILFPFPQNSFSANSIIAKVCFRTTEILSYFCKNSWVFLTGRVKSYKQWLEDSKKWKPLRVRKL